MKLENIGQSGLKIEVDGINVLVDPYLSNSVEELDGSDLVRQIPIPYKPEELNNIDWILVTHDHIDHCDPQTLSIVAQKNPKAKFIGPLPVRKKLKLWNIDDSRIIAAKKNQISLGEKFNVLPIASAHPKLKIADDGFSSTIGWFFEIKGVNIYVAGDTSLCDEILIDLMKLPKINIGVLPVNEDNFFRRRRGIIGNMSIREAFGMADALKMEKMVPVHWDMFEINSTLPSEILSVYKGYDWNFKLIMNLEELFK